MTTPPRNLTLRFSEDAYAQLCRLAEQDGVTKTACVTRLIREAAEPTQQYYLQLAATHSFLASTTALFLAYRLTTDPETLVNQLTTSASDLFGDRLPRPPSIVAKSSSSPLAAALINAYRKII